MSKVYVYTRTHGRAGPDIQSQIRQVIQAGSILSIIQALDDWLFVFLIPGGAKLWLPRLATIPYNKPFKPRAWPTDYKEYTTLRRPNQYVISIKTYNWSPIYTVDAGRITRLDRHPKYGRIMKIHHVDGYETLYRNLCFANVIPVPDDLPDVLDLVHAGQLLTWSRGKLLFSAKKDGRQINAAELLQPVYTSQGPGIKPTIKRLPPEQYPS